MNRTRIARLAEYDRSANLRRIATDVGTGDCNCGSQSSERALGCRQSGLDGEVKRQKALSPARERVGQVGAVPGWLREEATRTTAILAFASSAGCTTDAGRCTFVAK